MFWRLLAIIAVLTVAAHGSPRDIVEDGRPSPPNIVIILADDMGFSDLACYGSQVRTPNLDRLAVRGLKFTQFYNCARCCPSRAALLTGLYPHQTGGGHMFEDWKRPAYSNGLNEQCVTIAQLLKQAGYRSYHVGKWHVGGVDGGSAYNFPLNRGFDRAYGTAGGGDYYTLHPLYLDHEKLTAGPGFYATDAFTDYAVRFIEEHGKMHRRKPFFMHLCYTAPHFPLQALPEDIAKYRGKFRDGWDALRERRLARQKELGIIDPVCELSPRDPVAKAWSEIPESDKDEWDLRMAVHAAMVDRMDQGIGRVLDSIRKIGAEKNTLVVFLSDNGASAEFLDTWPNPARGHRPGTPTGAPGSHRCLEIAWANAANTPFRENKMWVHEGGISTPMIAYWPAVIKPGRMTNQVGHIIDFMPTFLELAGVDFPDTYMLRKLSRPQGVSLVPVLNGASIGERTLCWEHEGNRAIRKGDWKLVSQGKGDWELYDMKSDRTETRNIAVENPERVKELAALWQKWADEVGVVPWTQLPGASYKPTKEYRRKSEPVAD